MLSAPLEPYAGVKPLLSDHSTGEADSGLDNDPRLLSVNWDRAAFPGHGGETVECAAERRRLPREVLRQGVAAARMPEVLGDEAAPAFWARPERLLRDRLDGTPIVLAPNGLELPALGRQARMPARRHGHDFYSMGSQTAGKCAFPPRRKPRLH